MNVKQYIVDAFADKLFSGNPAAVCIMEQWISKDLMQQIAMENNLSETAFAVKERDRYRLRWFTPGGEIDMCGHATLACAYIVMNFEETDLTQVMFQTQSGLLTVKRHGEQYEMDFPAYQLHSLPVTEEMTVALGKTPVEAYLGRDMLCVMETEEIVRSLKPDMERVKALKGLLLHVTARGIETDCVSRSFAPKLQVMEDPVCGSGHCHIVPYWCSVLKKQELVAYQASARGGTLYCSMDGGRVKLGGKAVLYATAEIFI